MSETHAPEKVQSQGSVAEESLPQTSSADADSDASSVTSEFEQKLDEADLRANLFFETRLSDAEKLRLRGNDLFSQGDTRRALRRYRKGLYYSHFDEMQMNFELQDHHREAVEKVDYPLRLNASACLIQLEKFGEADELLGPVIEGKASVKAYYRRAKARLGLGNIDGAKEDVKAGLLMEKSNAALKQVQAEIRAEEVRLRQAQKQLWKGKLEGINGMSGDPDSDMQAAADASAQSQLQKQEEDAAEDEQEADREAASRDGAGASARQRPGLLGLALGSLAASANWFFRKLM